MEIPRKKRFFTYRATERPFRTTGKRFTKFLARKCLEIPIQMLTFAIRISLHCFPLISICSAYCLPWKAEINRKTMQGNARRMLSFYGFRYKFLHFLLSFPWPEAILGGAQGMRAKSGKFISKSMEKDKRIQKPS